MTELVLAVVLGTAFGFALNRVGATNPEYIINMLRLTDLHLMKVIMFAIGFASILLFSGLSLGWVDAENLSVKASYLGVIFGGILLGTGWAVSGYCPGTGLAAAATGRIDAWVFVIGGLVGALIYTLVHEFVASTGLLNDLFGGKVTLADTLNDKFPFLISDFSGLIVGVFLAIAFMMIAGLLPRRLRKARGDR